MPKRYTRVKENLNRGEYLMSDNVIQFPVTSAQREEPAIITPAQAKEATERLVSPEKIAEKSMQSQDFVMSLIEKNRKKGLEQVQTKLERLSEREINDNGNTENAIRTIQSAIQGLSIWAEATNSLVDLMKQDMIAVINGVQEQGKEGFRLSAHLQTLVTLLKEKSLITEDEMKSTWEKIIAPLRKQQVKS